ncbi:DUF2357 domain-containing protein [Halanaerobaculum tunisiense]
MAYQGKDQELIDIKTDKFTLTIKGQPVHPDIKQLYSQQEDSDVKATLEVSATSCELKEFWHFDSKEGLVEYKTSRVSPFFYEWQDYQIVIQSSQEADVEFYHQNRQIREAVTPLSNNQSILTGQINFRNDVGYSELEVRSEGRTLLTLKLEVFPSKVDYQEDYHNLLEEVNQEVYNLAYDFLRKTFQDMRLAEEKNISDIEFFTILRQIFSNFKQAFRRIEQAPHHNLKEARQVKPAGRVKKVNHKSVKWVRKNPRFYDEELGLPVKMLDIDKQVNFNTFENKFVKWIISETSKRIKEFIVKYKTNSSNIEPEVVELAQNMIRDLDLMISRSFLQEVGDLRKIDSLSLVLQMAPGYREIYKYYLMLKKGLSLNGELFNLSIKETWKLYEYWCFLKLNQILRNKYKLVQNNLIDFDYSGIYVTLKTSSNASVKYENPKTEEKFTLSYNSLESRGITTGQQPDNVLALQKEDSTVEYKFVFDAKYRINPAYPNTSYQSKYQTPGPEEETINTMHRYRDAIVSQEEDDFKRGMAGAYVLFPYHNEEEFREHHFYQSINQVNVGAFPFLPQSIELVTDFLEELIEEPSAGNYERNLLPTGTAEYQQQMSFKQNVLVGALSKKKQLDIVLAKNFYHIPCKRVDLADHKLKYIAIYQSKNKFSSDYGIKYYGRIKKWEVKQREKINLPLTKNNPKQPYYVFYIDQWKELNNPILPDGYGVSGSHIYTNDMLLHKAETLSELSIKNLKQWRVWLELSRLREELEVEIKEEHINNNTQLSGFKIDDIVVKVTDDNIIIENQTEKIERSFKDFLLNTRGVMKELF